MELIAKYYWIGKLMIFLLLPVNMLIRQRVAIEKWGLEAYKVLPAKHLYTRVSWKDSGNKNFRLMIRYTDYGIYVSFIFFLAGWIYGKFL